MGGPLSVVACRTPGSAARTADVDCAAIDSPTMPADIKAAQAIAQARKLRNFMSHLPEEIVMRASWHGGSRIGAGGSSVEVTPCDDAGSCDVKNGKDWKRPDFQGQRRRVGAADLSE